MDSGPEAPGTTPVRVLVVGSSSWTRAVATALEDRDGTVPVEGSARELDDRLESTDCVLTDDPAVCASTDARRPIVYAVDDVVDADIDALLADGASDVVEKAASDRPVLLEHRIRQAVRSSSTRPAIERREAWHRSLLERSSDLLVVFDASGRVTYVSPSAERIPGLEAIEFGSEYVFDDVHPEDRDRIVESFDAVCDDSTDATTTVTSRYRGADESWRVYEIVFTNRLDDPTVGGVVASIRDVTEHHHVERELQDPFERVTDAFFALDRDWRFTYLNDRAESIFEYDRSELVGREFLEVFPDMKGTRFQSAALESMAEQEPRTVEQYYDPYGIWVEARIYSSSSGISVYFTDVTDRVERERALAERTERLQTLIENVPVVLFVLDDEGEYALVEGRAFENLDLEPDDVAGESAFDLFADSPEICTDMRRALAGDSVHVHRRVERRTFEVWYRPITRSGDVDRVIGVAVDVTERIQYRDALNALHEATSHLLTVDSKQAACEYIVDVANDVLGLDSVLFRFDDQHNELVPAAYSSDLERAVGPPPRLGPDDSITWNTFVTDSPSVFGDVRESDLVYDESTDVRSGLYVPLGEHGVLAAVSTAENQYDDDTVELVKSFATTAEAALDRIGQTRRLHDHEQELKCQNDHLERLNRSNEIRQDIEEHLLLAESREAIEQGICDRLVDADACSFAWIGEPDPNGNRIRPRIRAGLDRGYLDAVAVTTVADSAAEPAGRAVRSRTPIHVENVATSVRDGTWRTAALSRSFQSVYAVPLIYDEYLYGVLSIYADDRNAFCETFRSMLADLGETIAYAIDAVKRKNALLEEGITEVELELTTDSALCRLADRLEARVSFEGATLQADGAALVFVAVDPPVNGSGVDAALDGIDDAVVIAETETQTLLQLRLTDPFLGRIVSDHGGTLREFVSEGNEHRAIIDVPDGIEIREVLSDVNRRGLSASLIARREQPSSGVSSLDARARTAMLGRLTARQQEVVRTAYHGGFFEWPRRTTGEEIAGSLDISSPAFHKHVRAVEQKLFTALFEGMTTSG